MSAIFYQKYLDTVGSDVTNMVLNMLNTNSSLSDINNTYISLVPKVKMLNRMKDFCPISLSNMAFKSACKPPQNNAVSNNL